MPESIYRMFQNNVEYMTQIKYHCTWFCYGYAVMRSVRSFLLVFLLRAKVNPVVRDLISICDYGKEYRLYT
jgi:hypothetical protein